MRTQFQIIEQIWETAQTLERMTKPSMMPVQDYDQALAAAAHDYARRLEMQADACDPGDKTDPALAWNRVESMARRLEQTLGDIEQTPGNTATISAAIALAAHCRVEASRWIEHPVGNPPPRQPQPLTNAEGKPWHQVAAERKAAEAEAAAPE